MQIARVALGVPLHRLFDYRVPESECLTAEDIGRRVRVSLGRRPCIGVIVGLPVVAEAGCGELKELDSVLRELSPLPPDWFRLVEFCSAYYQVPLGEVIL